ncbi:hypothetical protein JT366_08655 [Sphingomonas paucimobilis]|uniref:hypothetical protein n=1 Tax=Sphingomonas paucimobilis TaxID=13689 RepID=UPI0019633AD6|nr:hypothetical protein [Sphingomonas paucimobilis]QRY97272.1 hypothetical protein JT366_08655 [Sphingomonas paucimobilis]
MRCRDLLLSPTGPSGRTRRDRDRGVGVSPDARSSARWTVATVGERAARAERTDAAAGIWVARARAAYDTVNAASMADAIAHAKPLIAEMRSLVGVRP